jgi:hypothetical protein
MNESQVRELLRRQPEEIPVGPPPHAAIETLARRRRARSVLATAVAVAAVVVIGVITARQAFSRPAAPSSLTTQPSSSVSATTPPDRDYAEIEGAWRVVSMAVVDPIHRVITRHTVHPKMLGLTLSDHHWRADIPCGHMSGGLLHEGADLERQDPVHSRMNSCTTPEATDSAIANLANLMLRVRHWSLSDDTLLFHTGSGRTIVSLKREA